MLVLFFLGLIVGSFLNVVVYRYNTGHSINGRSKCLSCVRTLSWYELVPVFSYMAVGGKCRTCLSTISAQYPLVELVTGILFAAVWLTSYTLFVKVYALVAFCILVVISAYDFRHTIIPDGPVFAFIAMSFIKLFFEGSFDFVTFISGTIIALFFASMWYFSGGSWMGFGDAKLALGIGWFIPFPFNVTAIIFAFWIGAVIGVLMLGLPLVLKKISVAAGLVKGRTRASLSTEIPFAPYLALGAFITFIYPLFLW